MGNRYYKKIDTIARITEPIPAGICHIYFCPIEDVSSYPEPDPQTGIILDSFDVINYWYQAFMSNHGKQYKEDQSRGDGGDIMTVTLTAIMAFDNINHHRLLDRLKLHRYVVLVESQAKGSTLARMIKVIGTRENPAVFSHSFDSGVPGDGGQGTEISFTWNSSDKPLIYDGDILPLAPL